MDCSHVTIYNHNKRAGFFFKFESVQGDPGVDFVLTQSGINGYANETANEAFKDIENRISDHPKHFSTSYIDFITIWNIKVC